MRKLLLIAASALASVSAQADESRDLVLAANEASRSNARRETDEEKALRIAAHYGISR
jgi:hypothetical protein